MLRSDLLSGSLLVQTCKRVTAHQIFHFAPISVERRLVAVGHEVVLSALQRSLELFLP